MRNQLPSVFLAAALACSLFAAPAQATGVPRTFVSAAGSDSNNCANVATPCRHFATAFSATAPGGEIFVLDPANYGSLTITHAVSIEGHGWASIAPPNGGDAITINAGPSDSISIRGVSIDGTGATGPTNGIVFNSGGNFVVSDCIVQNFVGNGPGGIGIFMQPTSGTVDYTITNTTTVNNSFGGIYYQPPSGSPSGNGVIDHVVASANQTGIFIYTAFASGGTTVATISNTIASNNSQDSVVISSGAATTMKVSIDNVSVSGSGLGIFAAGTATVLLGRSVIMGNGTGVLNSTGNTFYSYGNNQINLNTTDIDGALNTTFKTQ
jgi:hypothetical protein